MGLFTPSDLQQFLRRPVEDTSAAQAERVASGWLTAATGIVTWPEPLPPDLYAWALELGAAVYDNPVGLKTLTVDNITRGYGGERIAAILAAARARAGSLAGAPRYSFPPPSWGEQGYVSA